MGNLTAIQYFQIFMGSGGILGFLYLIFKIGKIFQKIESIEKKMSLIESQNSEINTRISRIEGFLMGPQVFLDKNTGK